MRLTGMAGTLGDSTGNRLGDTGLAIGAAAHSSIT